MRSVMPEKPERAVLPKEIKEELKMWELGVTSFPKSFIKFHVKLAEERLEVLKADRGWKVHKEWVAGDGWMMGFQVLWVIVEKDGILSKIHWNEFNQDFMISSSTGGSFPIEFSEQL